MAKPVIPNMEDPSWINSLDLEQIIKLTEAAIKARHEKRQAALQEFKEKVEAEAQKLGVDLASFWQKPKPMKTGRGVSTLPPKYVDENGRVWSGKGRMAGWLAELVEAGHDQDKFLNPEWQKAKGLVK